MGIPVLSSFPFLWSPAGLIRGCCRLPTILGANPWQRFWQIELPILRPGIVSAGIFGFLLSFNELPRSIYLRGVATTLPLFEWAQAASQTSSIPYLFALSTVILSVSLPLIGVVTWALFRRAEE